MELVSRNTQYQVSAYTTVTDEVCADLATCTQTEFVYSALTGSTARRCRSTTLCMEGVQYESKIPSYNADAQCKYLTVCKSGIEFEAPWLGEWKGLYGTVRTLRQDSLQGFRN